jgi:small-conductance mechanosensitive channel
VLAAARAKLVKAKNTLSNFNRIHGPDLDCWETAVQQQMEAALQARESEVKEASGNCNAEKPLPKQVSDAEASIKGMRAKLDKLQKDLNYQGEQKARFQALASATELALSKLTLELDTADEACRELYSQMGLPPQGGGSEAGDDMDRDDEDQPTQGDEDGFTQVPRRRGSTS